MSQATLDDEELFGEAANEMRTDVEESLQDTRQELPEPSAIWTVEAENTLGVLNSLHTALDVGDAAAHLRDAKKWYTMGVRADAFDDAADLEEEIQTLEELIDEISGTHDAASELASTIPELRGTLDSIADEEDDDSEES